MMLVCITSPMSLWSQHNHNINKSSQLLVYTHTNLWWAEIETKTLTFLLLHFFQIILSYKWNTRFRFVVWCLLLHIDLKVLLSVSERPLLWAPFPTGRGRLEGKRKGAHNNQESEMQRITYTDWEPSLEVSLYNAGFAPQRRRPWKRKYKSAAWQNYTSSRLFNWQVMRELHYTECN